MLREMKLGDGPHMTVEPTDQSPSFDLIDRAWIVESMRENPFEPTFRLLPTNPLRDLAPQFDPSELVAAPCLA